MDVSLLWDDDKASRATRMEAIPSQYNSIRLYVRLEVEGPSEIKTDESQPCENIMTGNTGGN